MSTDADPAKAGEIRLEAGTMDSRRSASALEQPTLPKTLRPALRRQVIERRLALAAEEVARLSTAICAHIEQRFPQLVKRRVAFCWPIRNEPDLRPLIATWQACGEPGFAALLPVVIEPNAALVFRRWTPDCEMTIDRHNIPMPAAGAFERPDALLIPVNAFDAAGYRIGYGGGFFDRTLAALAQTGESPLAIGVGFEIARVETTWPQAYDLALDAIVTEAGVFEPAR